MDAQRKILFRRIAEGDKRAFDEFFDLYYTRLVQFARLFVDTPEQAEDVVSDVLTALLTKREKVFVLDQFEAYLYMAVKNRAISAIRRRQVADAYAEHIAQNSTPNAHDTLIAQELHDLVDRVIDSFPPKRRMVFQLIRDEELSYAQVAELLDISVRTVEVHLRLAVRELRQRIDAYHLHDTLRFMAREA